MLGRLTEQRAISFQTVWGSGADLEMLNPSGVAINQKTAFEIVAFFSAVSLISDTISTLPVDALYRSDGEIYPYRPRPTWIEQPDVDNTRQAHYQQVLVSLLIDGNSFTRVYRDRSGEVVNLVVLDPQSVEIKRNALGRKMFAVAGEEKLLSGDEIVHITDLLEPGALRGVSRVTKLSNAFGVASALQSYAATFFGSGASTNGVIEFPGVLTAEQAKNLQDGFDSRHKGWRKSHKTGILSGGASYKQTTVPNDSAQFLESRRFSVEEIARAFNIPLHLLGVPDTASYASVEQNAIQFVTHTLRPYVEKLEWAYTRLLPNPAYLKFNVNGLMRGDYATRIQSYSVGSQAGFLSVNDIRRMEDMRSVVGGDVYRVPLANVNLSAADLPEQEGKIAMATKLINAGFDPAATLAALGLPSILHDGGIPTTIQPMNPAGA
jgi:HK97 family phage portal protein